MQNSILARKLVGSLRPHSILLLPLEVFLVDGTCELFRHYYAVPSARDKQGREVGAVRGVLASVLGMIKDRDFDFWIEGQEVKIPTLSKTASQTSVAGNTEHQFVVKHAELIDVIYSLPKQDAPEWIGSDVSDLAGLEHQSHFCIFQFVGMQSDGS